MSFWFGTYSYSRDLLFRVLLLFYLNSTIPSLLQKMMMMFLSLIMLIIFFFFFFHIFTIFLLWYSISPFIFSKTTSYVLSGIFLSQRFVIQSTRPFLFFYQDSAISGLLQNVFKLRNHASATNIFLRSYSGQVSSTAVSLSAYYFRFAFT